MVVVAEGKFKLVSADRTVYNITDYVVKGRMFVFELFNAEISSFVVYCKASAYKVIAV